jgi:hypothetical protein
MTSQTSQYGSCAGCEPTPFNSRQDVRVQQLRYGAPCLFVIGHSNDLLRGSGRHKYDDTGSRGFEVG